MSIKESLSKIYTNLLFTPIEPDQHIDSSFNLLIVVIVLILKPPAQGFSA